MFDNSFSSHLFYGENFIKLIKYVSVARKYFDKCNIIFKRKEEVLHHWQSEDNFLFEDDYRVTLRS